MQTRQDRPTATILNTEKGQETQKTDGTEGVSRKGGGCLEKGGRLEIRDGHKAGLSQGGERSEWQGECRLRER